MGSDDNRRRGIRIDTRLRVRVVGVEELPRERMGNISVSGLYVDLEGYDGGSGTVERVEIETPDRAHRAVLLAVVVRVLHVDDLWSGSKARGVAFEFLLDNADERIALHRLIRAVAGQRIAEDGDLSGIGLDAHVDADGATGGGATVASLRSEGIVLETSWPVERGAGVRLVVDSPGSGEPLEVTGVVQKTLREDEQRYRVEVRLGDRFDEPSLGTDLANAMSTLLSEVVTPESPSRIQQATADLSGSLERVPLPSLLSFVGMERLCGVLRLTQNSVVTVVYLQDGRVVDVEGAAGPAEGRALLKAAIADAAGTFVVELGQVDRPDRFALPAGALVLDLVREIDEERA